MTLGGLIWRQVQEQKFEDFDQQVEEFRNEELKGFKEGKVKLEVFWGRAKEIAQGFDGHSFVGLFLLEVVDQFSRKDHPAKIVEFLQDYQWKRTVSFRVRELLGFHLAAAYEDLGQYSKAISELMELVPQGALKDKIYFDLGRYYRLAGNESKAEQSFDYVIREYADSQYAKLAETYKIKLMKEKEKEKTGKGGGGGENR